MWSVLTLLVRAVQSLFLSILLAAFFLACISSNQVLRPSEQYKSHTGQEWLQIRAQEAGISLERIRKRDKALAEGPVPDQLRQDEALKLETAAVWRAHCTRCHGPRGKGHGVKNMEIKPREFGTTGMSMGFFFGGDKMRAGIFRKIAAGSVRDGKELMPNFSKILSNEQIWGLVFYIESL